jgi:hypothetical protein
VIGRKKCVVQRWHTTDPGEETSQGRQAQTQRES